MDIIQSHPLIEQILTSWQSQIGENYNGYRGHVYRMFNCCLALRDCSDEDIQKLAIAAAFHDIGLWSDHTIDYLPPSVREAQQWLSQNNRANWSEEISLMIDMHHKIRPVKNVNSPLVELFRKADLVDFSLGLIKFGLSAQYIAQLKSTIPNAGFHVFLTNNAVQWFKQHPLRLPPFMKW